MGTWKAARRPLGRAAEAAGGGGGRLGSWEGPGWPSVQDTGGACASLGLPPCSALPRQILVPVLCTAGIRSAPPLMLSGADGVASGTAFLGLAVALTGPTSRAASKGSPLMGLDSGPSAGPATPLTSATPSFGGICSMVGGLLVGTPWRSASALCDDGLGDAAAGLLLTGVRVVVGSMHGEGGTSSTHTLLQGCCLDWKDWETSGEEQGG